MAIDVPFSEVEKALRVIRNSIYETPCPESTMLSDLCGAQIYCKREYLQRTGSFKERGARYALESLTDEQRQKGVITASAGNHALALAFHGRELKVPVTVVMPKFAPLIKQSRCRARGANVILHGESFGEARECAQKICADKSLTYIHGYDDPAIIAGQGTIGLELIQQVPDMDAVVVPIGGAGLIAGIALALKTLKPNVEIIGVEPINASNYSAAVQAGQPTRITPLPTLADGLAVGIVGENAFATSIKRVDRVVQVSEAQLAQAIVRLMELEKSVVEGAGASSLAAFLSGKLDHLKGKKVVLVLAGGNIDLSILSRLIEQGLVADGRLTRFTAVISDRPGGLARFAKILGDSGASIKELTHDRAFSGPDVTAVQVFCTIETKDHEHAAFIYQRLNEEKFPVRPQVPWTENS